MVIVKEKSLDEECFTNALIEEQTCFIKIVRIKIIKENLMKVNKKLWSFIFGCLIAGSFVWLIGFGNTAFVPDFLQPYPDFIIGFYPFIITAIMATVVTLIAMVVMVKVFNVYASEHPFWLVIPSITFVIITFFASSLMLNSMLSAAVPALFIMVLTAVVCRLLSVKKRAIG